MKMSESYEKKYLGHVNFEVPRILTIRDVIKEDVSGNEGPPDIKPVVYFHEHPKGFPVNRTNGGTLVELFGDETSLWTGKKCELYKAKTNFKGEMVNCVRIQAAGQQAAQAEPIAGFDDAPAEGASVDEWRGNNEVPEEENPF